jgi:glycosyltransferase involved in cell wall biosynthesis
LVQHVSRSGKRVIVLTDQPVDQLNVGSVQFQFVENWGASSLFKIITSLDPRVIFWAAAPTTVRHKRLLDWVSCPVVPLLMSPCYSWRQLLGVILRCAPGEVRSLFLQQCIPVFLWRRFLMHRAVKTICVTSGNSLERLRAIGIPVERTSLLQVGLDEDLRTLARRQQSTRPLRNPTRFVYLGSPKKIRGFQMLLDALAELGDNPELERMEFRLLTRGAPADMQKQVFERVQHARGRTTVLTGTLNRSEVLDEIRHADVVVLPFLLAPSDVPIAVLEAMALGAAVIATRVDGIPYLLEGRGTLLAHRTSSQLAKAMLKLHNDPEERARLGAAAQEFAATYPSWQESLDRFTFHLEECL